jgi:hypothetical protein
MPRWRSPVIERLWAQRSPQEGWWDRRVSPVATANVGQVNSPHGGLLRCVLEATDFVVAPPTDSRSRRARVRRHTMPAARSAILTTRRKAGTGRRNVPTGTQVRTLAAVLGVVAKLAGGCGEPSDRKAARAIHCNGRIRTVPGPGLARAVRLAVGRLDAAERSGLFELVCEFQEPSLVTLGRRQHHPDGHAIGGLRKRQ